MCNLYLHTALSHVLTTVGAAFSMLNRVCDDTFQGNVTDLNRYFNRRTNKVSRVQSLINSEAMAQAEFSHPSGRILSELLLLIGSVVVCQCVARLSPGTSSE